MQQLQDEKQLLASKLGKAKT
jgi:hypothetical protein